MNQQKEKSVWFFQVVENQLKKKKGMLYRAMLTCPEGACHEDAAAQLGEQLGLWPAQSCTGTNSSESLESSLGQGAQPRQCSATAQPGPACPLSWEDTVLPGD